MLYYSNHIICKTHQSPIQAMTAGHFSNTMPYNVDPICSSSPAELGKSWALYLLVFPIAMTSNVSHLSLRETYEPHIFPKTISTSLHFHWNCPSLFISSSTNVNGKWKSRHSNRVEEPYSKFLKNYETQFQSTQQSILRRQGVIIYRIS